MTTLKSIITPDIPTDLTALYTNNSAGGASLKAINVNHTGDLSRIDVGATDASEWGFIGAAANLMGQNGVGMPYPIKLGPDRCLLIIPMAYQTIRWGSDQSSPGESHAWAQIVEYRSGKYVCGPLTRIVLPAPLTMISSSGVTGIRGVAVTATQVAIVQAEGSTPYLSTLTISGNQVSSTVYSVNLNTDGGFYVGNNTLEVCPVPGDTTKVVVFGQGVTNFIAAAYTVSPSASPLLIGTAFDTGIGNNTHSTSMGVDLHRRSSPVYMFAGFTSSTALSARIISFVSASNTWAAVSPATSIPLNSGSSANGVHVRGLSNGAAYSSVIVATNTPATSIQFSFQTTAATITSALTNFNYGAVSSQNLNCSYNVGNQRAIFTGSGRVLAAIDGGTVVDLSVNMSAASTALPNHCIPFETRPLVSNNTSGIDSFNYYGWVGGTATSFGTSSTTGNYFPHGFPTGKHVMWSDTAGGYFIGQGGYLYLVDKDGTILAERNTYSFNANANSGSIKCLTVSPKGYLAIGLDTLGTQDSTAVQSASIAFPAANNARMFSTASAVTAANLSSVTFSGGTVNGARYADMVSWTGADGVERSLSLLAAYDGGTTSWYYGWSLTQFGAASPASLGGVTTGPAIGASASGVYHGISLVQTSPPSAAHRDGLFIWVGSVVLASTAKIRCAASPSSPASTLGNTSGLLDGGANNQYFLAPVSRSQGGYSAVFASGVTGNTGFAWISFGGSLITNFSTGGAFSLTPGALQPMVTVGPSHASVVWGASGAAIVAPTLQQWASDATYKLTTNGTASMSFPTVNRSGPWSVKVFGTGFDALASSYDSIDTSLTLTLNDGTKDFYLTPNGGTAISKGATYRANDTYYVPAGYSVKAKASNAKQLTTLLSVVEEV